MSLQVIGGNWMERCMKAKENTKSYVCREIIRSNYMKLLFSLIINLENSSVHLSVHLVIYLFCLTSASVCSRTGETHVSIWEGIPPFTHPVICHCSEEEVGSASHIYLQDGSHKDWQASEDKHQCSSHSLFPETKPKDYQSTPCSHKHVLIFSL